MKKIRRFLAAAANLFDIFLGRGFEVPGHEFEPVPVYVRESSRNDVD